MAATEHRARSGGRRLAISIIVVLMALLLIGAARWGYWVAYQYRFTTVTPNQVYRTAAMPAAALAAVVEEHGIRSVVDLRTAEEVADGSRNLERRELERLGVRYLPLPSGQVPQPATVTRFLEHAGDRENRPMLVHCVHGEGRSVLFTALYRIEIEGWSNERARRATRLLPAFSSFDIDEAKGRFLHNYQASTDEPDHRHNPRP